ncbi:MAG: flagellar motor switch protein FliN [Acidimicrobiia bacterium]
MLASSFQLGDETRIADAWPVDDGDGVLTVSLIGDAEGMLYLAVSEDVSARLMAQTDVLTGGLSAAVAALSEVTGLSLTADEVNNVAPATGPEFIAEILDGGTLTALAGLVLPVLVETEVAPEGAPAAPEQYEPTVLTAGRAAPTLASYAPMALLHDVELVVTAELGRTTMPVRELLGLTPGMVVEIDRAAGAPIDLLVNGKLIAAGEVVVIDEEFGIRITEIAPVSERT